MYPFLKWAGGKKWLARTVSESLPEFNGTYYEPFLGGGSMFFALRPDKAVLSDTNSWLIDTYEALRDSPRKVIKHLEKWKNTNDDYYRVRASRFSGKYIRAAQFIYLNKTCWNGLFRVNKQGGFNVPYSNNKRPVYNEEELLISSAALQDVEFRVCDFEEGIREARNGDLVYMDPPYTVLHSKNGFRRYNESLFTWSDQLRLSEVALQLAEQGCRVIVSNAFHSEVTNLYSKFYRYSIDRHSTISAKVESRRKTTETIFLSFTPPKDSEFYKRFTLYG